MPRRTRTTATPTKLRQGKLDVFLSSTPAPQPSPVRPQTRRSKRKAKATDSDQDVAGPSHLPITTAANEEGSQSSDAGAIHFEPRVLTISSSEDEGDLPPRPTFSSRGKKRTKRAHSIESASAPSSVGEKELYVRKGKRAAKKAAAAVLDSDEEEELRPLKKRKLVKGERPLTPEEDDLMDEVDEHSMSFSFYYLILQLNYGGGIRDH